MFTSSVLWKISLWVWLASIKTRNFYVFPKNLMFSILGWKLSGIKRDRPFEIYFFFGNSAPKVFVELELKSLIFSSLFKNWCFHKTSIWYTYRWNFRLSLGSWWYVSVPLPKWAKHNYRVPVLCRTSSIASVNATLTSRLACLWMRDSAHTGQLSPSLHHNFHSLKGW